jgi:hypothetical protein
VSGFPLLSPYPEGHYLINASHLYVTRGIGTAWAPIRLNASPEVVLLTPADEYRGVKRMTNSTLNDELRPEYDFASMKGGVPGKYAERFRKGTNIVLVEPEVALAFPSEDSVNEALRGVLNTARAVRRTGGLPNAALQPTSRARRTAKPRQPARAARG